MKHVLIADEVAERAWLVREILVTRHLVTVASTGAQALFALRASGADLLILSAGIRCCGADTLLELMARVGSHCQVVLIIPHDAPAPATDVAVLRSPLTLVALEDAVGRAFR